MYLSTMIMPLDGMAVSMLVGCCGVFLALVICLATQFTPVWTVAFLSTTVAAWRLLRRDRWAALRRHRWSWVRRQYQAVCVYHFAWRLDCVCAALAEPEDAVGAGARDAAMCGIVDAILQDPASPNTYQKKDSNVVQIVSLMQCVCTLVQHVESQRLPPASGADEDTDATPLPLVIDLGAGKALLTRAVYEALDRRVAVVALDCRDGEGGRDLFYDPVKPKRATAASMEHTAPLLSDGMLTDSATRMVTKRGGISYGDDGPYACMESESRHDAPYMRVVADLGRPGHLAKALRDPLRAARATKGSVVAITKHLCGGFTDASLMALCEPPLGDYVGAACLAPCCHQKTLRTEYCNMPFLESVGFCATHTGLRGGAQDNDFRTLCMLIQMSRASSLEEWEYAKSPLLQLLGFERVQVLGRKARRLFEEGRMRYLQGRGFDTRLVRYCEQDITSDNLAIMCTRRTL